MPTVYFVIILLEVSGICLTSKTKPISAVHFFLKYHEEEEKKKNKKVGVEQQGSLKSNGENLSVPIVFNPFNQSLPPPA